MARALPRLDRVSVLAEAVLEGRQVSERPAEPALVP
jgi:hypothetical protein